MKKGLPKCVCAPNCKATAAANKHQKATSAKKIAVIQMPEMRNLKRNEKRLPSEMQNDEPTLIVANFNRRQSSKKPNQRTDSNKNSNEALVYSPLINANLDHQVQIHQGNVSNDTDQDANAIGMKIRSGFFNDHTVKVTSNDDFYVGNFVSLLTSKRFCTKTLICFMFFNFCSQSFRITTQFAVPMARLIKTNAN